MLGNPNIVSVLSDKANTLLGITDSIFAFASSCLCVFLFVCVCIFYGNLKIPVVAGYDNNWVFFFHLRE